MLLFQVEIKDIEQLVTSGQKSKACPYYSSRHAIPTAEVSIRFYCTIENYDMVFKLS